MKRWILPRVPLMTALLVATVLGVAMRLWDYRFDSG